jgi:site-specific recombinase XerD
MRKILLPNEELPSTIARPVVEDTDGEAKGRDGASLLPAILAGHHTPGVADRVNKFCLSVADIFESWVNRCHSPHTRRAYRADVMSFAEFMEITWLEAATDILKVTIADVLDFRGYMLDLGMAPKTVTRRVSSLSSFYKYLAAAAAETRLPIVVPNPAHAQFVPRGSADARDETKALTATRARQLMGMPTGDDLVDYRDRAILKVYLYTGIRLTTGCRLKVSDFHQDGEATLKLHEKGDKRRTIGLHFNAAQAIGEYIEKAGITSGPLFRAQAAPRSREKLSKRPMDSATMYRLIQGYLRRLPGAMKKKQLEDGAEVEYCIYTPHSLRATTATLLLDAGVDIKKVQDLLGHRHITTTQIYDKRRIAASQSASHDVPI